MFNKNYNYFVSFSYSKGFGCAHSFAFKIKINSKNIIESIKIFKKVMEKERNISDIVVTNFILLK